jgi:hypothetical protein
MDISNQDFAPRQPRRAMSGQPPQHPTLAQALAQSLLMPSTIQGTSPATPAEPKTSPTKSTLAMQATYSRAYPRTKAHVRICNLSSLLCSDSQQCTSFPRQLCRPRRARPIPPDPAPDRPPHPTAAPCVCGAPHRSPSLNYAACGRLRIGIKPPCSRRILRASTAGGSPPSSLSKQRIYALHMPGA